MKELSIFVDESGDFGEYNHHAPFYIISMVLHDQIIDIEDDLKMLERELNNIGWSKHCGMLVRLLDRRKSIEKLN